MSKEHSSELVLLRLKDYLSANLPSKLVELSDHEITLESPQLVLDYEGEVNLFPAIRLLWQSTEYEQLVEETSEYELRKTIHSILIDVVVASGEREKLTRMTLRYCAAIEALIQSATDADKTLDSTSSVPSEALRFNLNLDPEWKIARKYVIGEGGVGGASSALFQRHVLEFEAIY